MRTHLLFQVLGHLFLDLSDNSLRHNSSVRFPLSMLAQKPTECRMKSRSTEIPFIQHQRFAFDAFPFGRDFSDGLLVESCEVSSFFLAVGFARIDTPKKCSERSTKALTVASVKKPLKAPTKARQITNKTIAPAIDN